MIFNQFEIWARTAPSSGRADGISALARAYLYSHLDAAQRADAERVMTVFLDDPSPQVRRALAEALASACEAPHHLVLALADDCAAVSTLVLARSPILSDAELIDCVTTAEPAAQAAIAARDKLAAPVAAALAEIATPEALTVLAANVAAQVPLFAIRRMIERHGDNARLRESLLSRPDLPASVRVDLVAATAKALGAYVTERNWLSGERVRRLTHEAGDRAAVTIASGDGGSRAELVAHLRQSGRLTPGFAFRAILSGKIELFKAILVELSGMSASRVDSLTRMCATAGFAALYRRCGLPGELLPATRVALEAARSADWTDVSSSNLSRAAIERVLSACALSTGGELDKLMVLLRRFEAEAARDEVRCAPSSIVAPTMALKACNQTDEDILVLVDLDAHVDPPVQPHLSQHRRTTRLAVDLTEIEAELCAA